MNFNNVSTYITVKN